jgi:16S rRNA processing protein RimM
LQLVVGRIGRAHGVLGEATIEVRTDDADQRFSIGNKLTLDSGKQLEIKSSRWHNQVLLLSFIGINDRNQVEELRDLLEGNGLESYDMEYNSYYDGEYTVEEA